jgi:hypothetical protein
LMLHEEDSLESLSKDELKALLALLRSRVEIAEKRAETAETRAEANRVYAIKLRYSLRGSACSKSRYARLAVGSVGALGQDAGSSQAAAARAGPAHSENVDKDVPP